MARPLVSLRSNDTPSAACSKRDSIASFTFSHSPPLYKPAAASNYKPSHSSPGSDWSSPPRTGPSSDGPPRPRRIESLTNVHLERERDVKNISVGHALPIYLVTRLANRGAYERGFQNGEVISTVARQKINEQVLGQLQTTDDGISFKPAFKPHSSFVVEILVALLRQRTVAGSLQPFEKYRNQLLITSNKFYLERGAGRDIVHERTLQMRTLGLAARELPSAQISRSIQGGGGGHI
ncbi:hypothetical protein FIBSPDRAFT_881770 [Athelia psychrophila]|uniref:Uncharacterized protein n=1 Tax=Athelia psychrophila TaxID=1759441 RepID=A0A166WCB8_9AGAM|nr:hypothetical protein FIBSPDRAFT_881770 [Fibularhizoctonia sp. CBS 109695]